MTNVKYRLSGFFELHSPALLTEFFFFYHGRKHRTQILPSLPFLSVQFTSVYSYRRDQSPEFYLVKLKLHKLNNTFLPPLLGTNYPFFVSMNLTTLDTSLSTTVQPFFL